MNLFDRYESDEFDNSPDFDDLENEGIEESTSSRPFVIRAGAMLMAVVGFAYGANIVINGNPSGGQLEYGQGVVALNNVACDTNSGITLTPYAGFINPPGKWVLDSIVLENVDKTCVGSDFIIEVWTDDGQNPLTISEETETAGTYISTSSFRFHFADSATVTSVSSRYQYTDVEVLTDVSDGTEYDANQNSFLITFDPNQVSSFADATQIYKITLQTTPHTT